MRSSSAGLLGVAGLATIAVLLCLCAQLVTADSLLPAASAAHSPLSFAAGGPHNSSAPMDPLDIGMATTMKMDFWAVYVFFNFFGCILCVALIVSVWRLSTRSSSDVLAGALCWSCFVHSASCGVQCLLNLLAGGFAHGMDACYVEALFHLISIISMFWTLALMAFDSHRTVVKGESMGVKRALMATAAVWAFTALGVGLFSLASPIYMAPSGVFCFFAFDSALMYAFFLPSFLIAAGAMAFFYFRIFQITRSALQRMHASNATVTQNRTNLQMRLAQKLFLFVLVFLASFLGLVLGILVQLITGHMNNLDAIGGVTAVIHSSAVPIAYGLINPRLRGMLLDTLSCGAWGRWFAVRGSSDAKTTSAAPGKPDTVLHCGKDFGAGSTNRALSTHKPVPSVSRPDRSGKGGGGGGGGEQGGASSRTLAGAAGANNGPTSQALAAKAPPARRALMGHTPRQSLDFDAYGSSNGASSPGTEGRTTSHQYGRHGRNDSLLLSPPTHTGASMYLHSPTPDMATLPLMELPNAVVSVVDLERDEPLLTPEERARFLHLRSLSLPSQLGAGADFLNHPPPQQQQQQQSTSPSSRTMLAADAAAAVTATASAAGSVEMSVRRISPPSPPRALPPLQPLPEQLNNDIGSALAQHSSFGNEQPAPLQAPVSPIHSTPDSDADLAAARLSSPSLLVWPAPAPVFRPSSRATIATFNSSLLQPVAVAAAAELPVAQADEAV